MRALTDLGTPRPSDAPVAGYGRRYVLSHRDTAPKPPRRSGEQELRRYGVAVFAVALTLAIRLLLAPVLGGESPFYLFFGAVMVSAWFGGLAPGLLATALSALAADYFLLSQLQAFPGYNSNQDLSLGFFALEGMLISWLSEALHSARRRVMASEVETRSHRETLDRTEERFRALVEGVKDYAIFMLDTKGSVTSWSSGAERIKGYRADEIIGRHFSCFYPDDVPREQIDEELRTALREGQFENEGWRLRKDGSRFYANVLKTPLRGGTGKLLGFSTVTRDITERKRDEASLRFLAEASAALASSHDYRTTLASVARLAVPELADWCVVDMVEAEGECRRLAVVHQDPAKVELGWELARRFPLEPEGLFGPEVLRSGRSELVADVPDSLLRAVAHDAEHLEILRGLGFQSCICVPLRLRGRTLGAITLASAESGRRYGPADLAFAEDLARRAALAIENARLYGEAQVSNRAKDEFLTTLSHELRTPLTSMLGWAQLLRTGQLDGATAERALEMIESSAKLQAQLIEDLLDVSRIISGKLRLEARPVELGPIIEAAVDAVRPAAEAKEIRLHAALGRALGQVSGDTERLQQIIWNLLSNAIKFTPQGGRVAVRLARVGAAARIRVTDTGRGISPEFLPYVFDRFRQADVSTTRTHSGLGLGLSIVRHLVELQGGTVRAESPGEGRGATFTVEFPLRPARAVRGRAGGALGRSGARETGQRHPDGFTALEGLRLLVVDDEADARELLTVALERSGAEVTAVGSASEALREIERVRPDVLLSDIAMPGEDGYAFIRRVRAREAELGGRIPAAALTAYTREEDRRRALQAGFQMHVAKPVEPAELTAVVANLAGRRVGRRAGGRAGRRADRQKAS
jgi:PAS domain S-box-containing protein